MNLASHVKSLFSDSFHRAIPIPKETEIESESLLAIVIPRKCLTESVHYKGSGVVVSGELERYAHSCAFDIGRALLTKYGKFFDVSVKEGDLSVAYEFKREDRKVTYALMGLPCFESSYGQRFGSDVTGMLTIEEPTIDLKSAGTFISAVLETHLLDYREHTNTKWGIFYKGKSKENQQNVEGIPLLHLLEIQPTEAAEFFQIMYFGGYRHKVFQPGELNL